MSRQRFIYPEFFSSEDLGSISRDARLLFAGMFTLADDYGRGKASIPSLRSTVFPYDKDLTLEQVEIMVGEIRKRKLVRFYDVDGSRYYEVIQWDKYQTPKYRSKTKIPPFQSNSGRAGIRAESGTNPGQIGAASGPVLDCIGLKRREEKSIGEGRPKSKSTAEPRASAGPGSLSSDGNAAGQDADLDEIRRIEQLRRLNGGTIAAEVAPRPKREEAKA